MKEIVSKFFLSSLSMNNILWIYILLINTATFVFRGRDKRKAVKGGRRVSEKQLLWLVILGGGAGALLGQHLFRHKTIKGKFVWKMYLAILCRMLILASLFYASS